RSVPESGSFGVGGTAPTRYQFYSNQSAASYAAAMQLASNYAGYSTSFIGNIGGWGTVISHNREPQLGGFTNGAVAPNQERAVDITLGVFNNNYDRMFAVTNYPGGTPKVRFLIRTSTGNVGIGSDVEPIMTANPTKRLVVSGDIHVHQGTIFGHAMNSTYTPDGVWNAAARPSKIITPNMHELRFGYSDAGTGQYYPSIGFSVDSSAVNDSMLILQARVAQGTAPEGFNRFQVSGGGTIGWGPGSTAVDATLYRGAPGLLRTNASVTVDGNVGIGTTAPTQRLHVEGNIHVSGNINAKYQDMAEWVPSNSDLAPGTVVVLDPEIGNGVKASSGAYDTAVAGVVSAQPGIILGEAGASKEQIATTGRVRVRVDATSAPIRVGDLLVTGDKPGMAMRSDPMELGGRKFHQPGTIVGKALEHLEKGEGEILVLLSLQ
ncbi:hypothetical protein L0Y59_00130, partial [Candidatus Uhrbacteria bacterium]|nr:hypothetical protein [Candidatus Uhrbacteria bacterium]